MKLARATAIVNDKVRKENLSAREMLFKRKLFSNEEMTFDDNDVRQFKMEDRKKQNLSSPKSKAKVKEFSPSANAKKGDLVFLKADGDKVTPRELYIVTKLMPDDFVGIQKLLHALSSKNPKLQIIRYKVKQTNILLAPNQSIVIPAQPVESEELPLPIDTKQEKQPEREDDTWSLIHPCTDLVDPCVQHHPADVHMQLSPPSTPPPTPPVPPPSCNIHHPLYQYHI